MALYAIGDLHLSFSADKPMDIFGGAWIGYVDKLREGFSSLSDADTTVLCGDLSWALSLEQALPDFQFIHEIPGRKIILKGNHDYWWTTVTKMTRFFSGAGFDTIEILHNNCLLYGDTAICGTRGWFEEEEGTPDGKVYRRELQRLETSLKAAGDHDILCFLHYPPKYSGCVCQDIIDLLVKYSVKKCYYGHLHGNSHRTVREETFGGILYRLISADYIGFRPLKILD